MPAALGAATLTGMWNGTVTVNGNEVPFRFKITASNPATAAGAFFNGDERVRFTSGRFVKNTLWL